MSRSRRRSSGRGTRQRYRLPLSQGQRQALEHIKAARRLSAELGGMDQPVKEYFFNLPPDELSDILDEYERRYDPDRREGRREYAEQTFPKWRSGRVKMSGMVGERLFNLLPPRMPLPVKYQIVEGLWQHVGPSSKHRIRVGLDAEVAQVVETARFKITDFVVNYKIPENIERRFDWLSAGDVAIKQMLLAHIHEIEKSIVVEAVRAQVPVMLEHLRMAGSNTGRLAQIVHVGKHQLELLMDKNGSGIRVEDASALAAVKPVASGSYTQLVWIVIAALVTFLIVFYWHR